MSLYKYEVNKLFTKLNCVRKKHTLHSIPTVFTKVQLIILMSKVANRFRHHNTLGERIPHIDNEAVTALQTVLTRQVFLSLQ